MNLNDPSDNGTGGAQTGSTCTHQAEREQQQQPPDHARASDSAQLPCNNNPNNLLQQNEPTGSVSSGAESSESHSNVQPLLTESFKEFQKNWQQQMKKVDLGSIGRKKNQETMSSQTQSVGHSHFSFVHDEAHAQNVAFVDQSAPAARAPNSLSNFDFTQQPPAAIPSAHATYAQNTAGAPQPSRQAGIGRIDVPFPGHHCSVMDNQAPGNARGQGTTGFQHLGTNTPTMSPGDERSRLGSKIALPDQPVSQVAPHTMMTPASLPPSTATNATGFACQYSLSHSHTPVAEVPSGARPRQVHAESRACAYCSKRSERLLSCSCRDVFYCDGQCQVAHWPVHKGVCAWRAKKRKEKAAKKSSGQQT